MKEVIEAAKELHDYLESMADGALPTADLFEEDAAHWASARAYRTLLLVARSLQLLLTDSPSMVGPLSPILKALTGDDQEEM